MKTLYILRHAKADPDGKDKDDHARELAERGRDDARRLGKWLRKNDLFPECAIVSTAARTRQTLEHLQEGLERRIPADFHKALYLAPAGRIFQEINRAGDAWSSLLLIGHNPGMHQAAVMLAGSGDPALRSELAVKFPTCALAVYEVNAPSWQQVEPGMGILRHFLTGKHAG